MTIWQVAAGDGSRDYSDVFLKFGVILVGPGSEGDYFANKDTYNNNESGAYRSFIEPFAERVRVGDLVVLKAKIGQRSRDRLGGLSEGRIGDPPCIEKIYYFGFVLPVTPL
jgi:hypothetical protein